MHYGRPHRTNTDYYSNKREGGREGEGRGGKEGGEGVTSHLGGGHRHYHSGAPVSPVTNHSLVFRLLRVFQN